MEIRVLSAAAGRPGKDSRSSAAMQLQCCAAESARSIWQGHSAGV